METATIKKRAKTRVVVEIDSDLSRKLKRIKAETDKPVWKIVEEALIRHFSEKGAN